MRSNIRPVGRGRRLFATALLVALPLGMTTACSEEEPLEEPAVEEPLEEEEDE